MYAKTSVYIYIYIYVFSSATRAGWRFPLASLKNDYKGRKSYETYMTYKIDPNEYISTVYISKIELIKIAQGL